MQTNSFTQFLGRWRALRHGDRSEHRLQAFLRAYRSLSSRPRRNQTRRVDVVRLRDSLDALREPLAQQREDGRFLNPWKMGGLREDEVRNAAVLAQFWSPQLCGTAAARFLDAFCRRLADPAGLLPSSAALLSGYHVRTEHCPIGEASERVDITIEGRDFVIGVEVKINAAEGPDQLRRYRDAVTAWARGRGKRPVVIFLAPYPTKEAGVLLATWRDVAAAARAISTDGGAHSSQYQKLLAPFSEHISGFGGK